MRNALSSWRRHCFQPVFLPGTYHLTGGPGAQVDAPDPGHPLEVPRDFVSAADRNMGVRWPLGVFRRHFLSL